MKKKDKRKADRQPEKNDGIESNGREPTKFKRKDYEKKLARFRSS